MSLIYNLLDKFKLKNPEKTEESSHGDVNFCPVVNQDNNMPNLPNEPINGVNLDTKREVSSIPRAGYNQNWVYPSVMQFYNALVLKDKVNDDTRYMSEAVKAHNEVNEISWNSILKWEKLHEKECKNPTLRRFVGRYNKHSPKSILRRIFTRYEKPFDRHDWYIDRCGKEVRYILDYYDDPKSSNYSQVYVDVRPALDNWRNLYDRIRYSFLSFLKLI
ncbi:cytochrome C-type heme lyase [Theileria orientalis]|uniref:Holocytochrome c-type synthase n=1 Tax=Theileria orientalis TaxID=68886 RepID=A0A976MAH6_THEOR|nr:cytochrome C-type heme lyase [Theileria orientalis]